MTDIDEMERTHQAHRRIGAPDLAQNHLWIDMLAASQPRANESAAITEMRAAYLRRTRLYVKRPLTRAKRKGMKGLIAALRQVA